VPLSSETPVLVAGAGYVGEALIERLAGVGCPIYALRRGPGKPAAGARSIVADLTDPAALAQLPSDLRFIVYLVSPDSSSDAAYEAAYVTGLQNLLASAAVAGSKLERVLFASSTAVYAQNDGSWVDEASATRPEGFSGRRLLEAERLLASKGVPHVIVRFAGIYGPGRQRLLSSVQDGTAIFGTLPHITNRIHRDDCAGFLLHLMRLESPASLYVGVDDEPSELSAVLTWLAETLGTPPPRSVEGASVGRGGHKRCSNQRLRGTGYQLAYPSFREGYAALIREQAESAGK
jgi:nucleoside-diphosphate-sugar epimerase